MSEGIVDEAMLIELETVSMILFCQSTVSMLLFCQSPVDVALYCLVMRSGVPMLAEYPNPSVGCGGSDQWIAANTYL